MDFRPMIFGHQLLGDSHMVHLAMMLGYRLDWESPKSIGLCITGQSIPELRRRLENTLICEKVMLMIGNNDFQAGLDMKTIQMNYCGLVEYLLSRVKKLVILTIVPSPELIDGEAYRLRSMGFNRWLFSFNWGEAMQLYNQGRLTVFDVSSQFYDCDGIKEECFEELDRFNMREPDGLHLLDFGMELILDKLRSFHP